MRVVERNKPGKGRRNRVGVSMDTPLENDLERLAVACGSMAPTTLAYLLIKHCLGDPAIVDLFQMDYNTRPEYWVFHVTDENGRRRLEVKQ